MINDEKVIKLAPGLAPLTVPIRTAEEIEKEYASLCASAGDHQYMIKELEAKLEIMNQRLFDLKKEHHALKETPSQPADESHPFTSDIAP